MNFQINGASCLVFRMLLLKTDNWISPVPVTLNRTKNEHLSLGGCLHRGPFVHGRHFNQSISEYISDYYYYYYNHFTADGRNEVSAAWRAAKSPFCVLQLLHFCTFLRNPHFDLESDYVVREPIKRHFQQYFVRTEILSTFHTRIEYISQRTICHSVEDGM